MGMRRSFTKFPDTVASVDLAGSCGDGFNGGDVGAGVAGIDDDDVVAAADGTGVGVVVEAARSRDNRLDGRSTTCS
jgi:hypothetical protein